MEAVRSGYLDGKRLLGRLRFAEFARIRAEGEALISATEGTVELDLGRLEHANSLAVSVMIAWYRFAFHQGKIIQFSNVPPDLRKIIVVSGLVELLLGDE